MSLSSSSEVIHTQRSQNPNPDAYLTLAGLPVTIEMQWPFHGSGSGGDFFPWMFRQAKVGPLIGKRTAGVGIGPYFDVQELIDGGRVAAPNRAFYNPKKGIWDIENFGVAPSGPS